jgi:hypothetical protein
MLASHDVLDVKSEEGFGTLRQSAIFAAVRGAFANELPELLLHQAA